MKVGRTQITQWQCKHLTEEILHHFLIMNSYNGHNPKWGAGFFHQLCISHPPTCSPDEWKQRIFSTTLDTVSRSHVNNQCPNYNPSLKRGVHLPAAASALRKHFSSSSSAWLQSIGAFASCVEGYFGSGSLWGFGVQVDHKFMVTKGRVCRMYCFFWILLHPTVSTCEWEEHGFKFHRCFQPKPSNKLGQSIQLTQTDWSFDQLDMG